MADLKSDKDNLSDDALQSASGGAVFENNTNTTIINNYYVDDKDTTNVNVNGGVGGNIETIYAKDYAELEKRVPGFTDKIRTP